MAFLALAEASFAACLGARRFLLCAYLFSSEERDAAASLLK